MQAGRLRHRVQVQADTPTRDTAGQEVHSWATVATLWADVRQAGGQERFAGGSDQEFATVTHSVRIRRQPSLTITVEHRIVWESRILDIESVGDARGERKEMMIMCREVAP
ncbi:MAG: phage head closure protein [Caldilineaceae bacterium]